MDSLVAWYEWCSITMESDSKMGSMKMNDISKNDTEMSSDLTSMTAKLWGIL